MKSEPVSLPHAVEPSYSTPHDNPAHTGVVADPNMEYGEEYADYGGYEEADESYDTSGMVVEGQAGNKGETISCITMFVCQPLLLFLLQIVYIIHYAYFAIQF